ncbi:MAG: hypothetical protein H6760_01265 [Candidatus Nomurabacteria bacterium]|nr:MAG: hypothetical protein H6760_01265 [Candidatus Nomurabacteria bacterium]
MKKIQIVFLLFSSIVLASVIFYSGHAISYKNTTYGYSFSTIKKSNIKVLDPALVQVSIIGEEVIEESPIINIYAIKLEQDSLSATQELETWVGEDLNGFSDINIQSTTTETEKIINVTYTGGGMSGSIKYVGFYVFNQEEKTIIKVVASQYNDNMELFEAYKKILSSFQLI